jgi:Family of unknown function (DUF6012)
MAAQLDRSEVTMRPFLYHIRPRIFSPGVDAVLAELWIDDLGIRLKVADVRTGHPYPNKNWYVAHRRIGRKHVDGILLAFSDWPPNFGVLAHWAMDNAEYLLTRRTKYMLLDDDFAAASDDVTCWHARGKFKNRFPFWARTDQGRPITEVFPQHQPLLDVFDEEERLIDTSEAFALPTIEPERILGPGYPRSFPTPTLDMAIKL